MAVAKIDPKVIFASEAPVQDTPAVFTNKTVGWGESRKNGGRPTIKQSNALQQETDLKILWLNENSVTPFDAAIDYPENAVTIKDGVFKILNLGVWELFLDKSSVGLGNVDDTSDLNKPVSTAMQTALNLKADKSTTYTKSEVNNALDLLKPPYLSSDVVDGSQTQDQINLYGGKKYDMPVGGYPLNARVLLDNGDIVKSTVDGNTNDPNVDMTEWFLAGSDKIKTVLTLNNMLSLNPVDQDVVRVLSYYTPNYALAKPYLGSSEYVYKQSTVSKSDGFFNINGWNLIFSDTVDIYQVGFKGDYATDEGARLNSFLDAANKHVKSSRINKLILDGAHSYIMSSIPVIFDLCFVGAKNLDIVSTSLATLSSYTPFVTLKTTDSWADVPVNIRKTFKPTWENVRVVRKQGTVIQEKSIGLMLTPNSVVSMYNLKLLGGKVSEFDYGVVFDENSYLIEFDNFEISGCNVLKSTTFSLDINTGSQTNMGENIRFLSCTFANAGKVFEFKKGTGLGLHYFASSFDYCGGTVATGGKRWFDLQSGSGELSFYGCHFESGNTNAGLLNNMFYNGYRWKVSIIGGEMLFSSTTYNNCQHFCYNAENGQISITGTKIFAPSVRYWANKGLRDFSPMFNFNDLGERYITENYSKSNALDPRMESSNIIDLVVCNGFTTNVNSSSQVVASRTGVNIDGITYPALLLRKQRGRGTDDIADIYIPRDHRTKFISSGALKAYNPENTSNDVVNATLNLVKARQLDSNGIPIALDTKQVAYSEWTTESAIKEYSCKHITYAEDCIGYNWYKLSLRLFAYTGNGYFYILGLGFEEPDE